LLGKETYVSLEFGIPRHASADRAALTLIKQYMNVVMYETLRLEESLSYDPEALFRDYYDFSTLELSANVFTGREDEALALMQTIVQDVRDNGLPNGSLKSNIRIRQYLLASAFEANADFAYFYESFLPYLRANNAFPNMDSYFSDVTSEDVRRVAELYLAPERSMTYIARPALTPNSAAAAILALLISVVALILWRRQRPNASRLKP
jgi:predicted Zn-dependent peptidase